MHGRQRTLQHAHRQLHSCLLPCCGCPLWEPSVSKAATLSAGDQEYIEGTADGWRARTIYQVVTDRFYAPKLQYAEGGEPTPCNVTRLGYCGGTFATVEDHLDYIMGMNFGAVWISPTVVNAPGGYHGYWCAPASP